MPLKYIGDVYMFYDGGVSGWGNAWCMGYRNHAMGGELYVEWNHKTHVGGLSGRGVILECLNFELDRKRVHVRRAQHPVEITCKECVYAWGKVYTWPIW